MIDSSFIVWLNLNCAFVCCCFYSMHCNEIKRAEGAMQSEREPSIKMWENVARSNVDYLLLWQWVWILQAAGLLLFLNKAFFLTDQWMKILTVETNLLNFTRLCKHWCSALEYLLLNLLNSSYRITDERMHNRRHMLQCCDIFF